MEMLNDPFMIVLKKGTSIVYKTKIKYAHFFPCCKNNLNKDGIEPLEKFLEEKKIKKPDPGEAVEPQKTDFKLGAVQRDPNPTVPHFLV